MEDNNKLQLFQDQKVRTYWDEEQEKWYFSVIDVIAILADNSRPRKYWNDLKKKLCNEGSELSENIGQFKMKASDGKMRMTDIAATTGGSLSVLSILVFLSFQPTPTPAISTTESTTAGVCPQEQQLSQSVSTLYES